MPTFNNGETGLSIRNKINKAIDLTDRVMIVDDVTQLANLVYDLNSQWGVAAGMQVVTAREGFSYDVLASASATFHIQPGAVKLKHLPGENGAYNFRAMLPAANGTTDDFPLLDKLLDEGDPPAGTTRRGPAIYFPPGTYFMGSTIEVKETCRLYGEALFAGGGFATLRFAANTTGIVVNRSNTLSTGIESPQTTGGDASCIEGLTITSAGGTDRSKPGIWIKARCIVRSCLVSNFPGNGIQVIATAGGGGTVEGNANCFYIENVICISNRNHGFYAEGADANAGTCVNLDCSQNGRFGIYDSSFLGNTYIGCHTATNGLAGVGGNSSTQSSTVRFGGNGYTAHWDATEAQLVATQPGTNGNVWILRGPEFVSPQYPLWQAGQPEGTYFRSFAYFTDDPNAANVFIGCYNEADAPCAFLGAALVFGGKMEAVIQGNMFRANGQGQYQNNGMVFDNGGYTATTTDGTGWLTLSHGSDGFPWRLKRDTNGDILLDHANLGARQVFRVKGESASRPFKFAVNDFLLADRMMAMGTAAPTTGTWVRGDYVRNSSPAVGQPKGWVCTVSGTPGTWVSEGNL